ncbi:uncharacterized protein LOC114550885 isoform X1 [Perca flavescens]|uniref:uncharacterized protein LOC114550885 isoform X1 n=1 Tax=Perca flavescens TaxID=8167 RepID=UPI00106EA87D|nr:uncharacterized protein LOC114550885 isoform X1 [Perca flavescens]XP_028427647.1 uncharacterized protein LOC114550885 isoform X1 [Perca flavescens]
MSMGKSCAYHPLEFKNSARVKKAAAFGFGGKATERPGVYAPGKYDLADFCVEAVEPRLGHIAKGDLLIGPVSSGVPSNCCSLVCKLLERANQSYSSPAPFWQVGTDCRYAASVDAIWKKKNFLQTS